MKVTLSVIGKFHIFNLAQQLLKRDSLARLITSYPKFEAAKYDIPRDKVHSIIIKEILQRGWAKLPLFLRRAYNPQYFIHELFDMLAARALVESDIFVGGSSASLHTMTRAREMGMIIILEHGSSHIIYQAEILKEEYEKFGVRVMPFQFVHQKIIEKELKEYEEADYISIPSSYVKRTFIERGVSEKKIIQVPYGVDFSKFRQIPKGDDMFRVIFAGGITLRKGVHYLLRVFSELHLPNSELMLIGTMSEEIKPFFKKYDVRGGVRDPISRGDRISPVIRYMGHVPQKELYKYYSQGSVFVMPSIEEGLALVQSQAMACGLPVIATTNTGGEDIIRDGVDGFIIPIRDTEAMKEKILYCYENPEECVNMGQSAKEHVAGKFTWDNYGKAMVEVYENILTKKNQNKN